VSVALLRVSLVSFFIISFKEFFMKYDIKHIGSGNWVIVLKSDDEQVDGIVYTAANIARAVIRTMIRDESRIEPTLLHVTDIRSVD